jgi:hypothetical protein
VNQAPVLESISVGAERLEVEAEVTVTATVRDAETAVDQLRFDWSADGGSFAGTGPSVRWRAPKGPATPADYTLRLTVVETYGTPDQAGTRPQHSVSGTSAPVRVHDSPKEIADLSLGFLRDFANSSIPADVAVRDFSDSCSEKAEERQQIADNRRHYQIVSSQFTAKGASVRPGGMSGDSRIACEFWSVIKECEPGIPNCVVGGREHVRGDCDTTGVYEQKRWWLCTSRFNNPELLPSMRSFISMR